MAKKKTASSAKTMGTADIQDKYIEFLLLHGRRPESVFAFVHTLGIAEKDFYAHYASFDAVDAAIWKDMFAETVAVLEKDKQYANYSAREKVLALFYTWIETLLARRSYVKYHVDRLSKNKPPAFLKPFRQAFTSYAQQLVNEGISNDEIVERPYLSEQYDKAVWLQALFILKFWTDDNSQNFEKTDAAIEKSVNLLFELLGRSALDSMLDFGKFLWQSQRAAL